MKKVSVIIPAFNKYFLTKKTINSVLNQTYKHIEIIVVDDGSTDETYKIKNEYKDLIKYFYQKNQGVSSARNFGIKQSTGEYLAFIDCDDLYESEKIEKSINILLDNPSYGFYILMLILLMQMIKKIKISYIEKNHPGNGYIAKKILLSNSNITNSTLLVKKECINLVGFFDEKIFIAADRDILLRLAFKFKAYYLNKKLTNYRVGSGNFFIDLNKSLNEFLYLLDKNINKIPNLPIKFKNKCYSNVYYNFAKNMLHKII